MKRLILFLMLTLPLLAGAQNFDIAIDQTKNAVFAQCKSCDWQYMNHNDGSSSMSLDTKTCIVMYLWPVRDILNSACIIIPNDGYLQDYLDMLNADEYMLIESRHWIYFGVQTMDVWLILHEEGYYYIAYTRMEE